MSYYNYHDGFGDIKTAWLNEESTLVCPNCGTPDIAFSDDDQNHCVECEKPLPRNPAPAHRLELIMDCDGVRSSQEEIQAWLRQAIAYFRHTDTDNHLVFNGIRRMVKKRAKAES